MRERCLVPVLVFLGMVVAVVLGAPLIPTIARTEDVPLAEAQ